MHTLQIDDLSDSLSLLVLPRCEAQATKAETCSMLDCSLPMKCVASLALKSLVALY